MRSRIFLLALGCWAAAVGLTGCGWSFVGFKDSTGDLEDSRVVVDLIDRAFAAEIVRERSAVDVGAPSSLDVMGPGWGDPEINKALAKSFAWATSEIASLEFLLFDTEFDRLDIQCRALSWEGGPEQGLVVTVNGTELDRITLESTFSEYSIPLSGDVLQVGTNRIDFRFDWTSRPPDQSPGSTDERTLAAAFLRVALGSAMAKQTGRAHEAKPVILGDKLFLPSGSGLRYRFVAPEDAILEIEVAEPGPGDSDSKLVAWLAAPGQPAVDTVMIEPAPGEGGPTRLKVGWPAGEPMELGFAAAGNGEPEAGVSIVGARVWGRAGGNQDLPNVLLIVVDTLRADYLGAYGGDVHTPNVDELAARGVRFARARSHIPITGPSHASLFTSLLPMEHGVTNNAQELDPQIPTLAETLQSAGRRTAAVISLGVLQRQFGFDRGFDLYGDGFPRDWLKDAVEVTDEALQAARTLRSDPYFLWVHYSDPHEPYAPLDADYPRFDLRLEGKTVGTIDARGRGFWIDVRIPPGESMLEFVPFAPVPDRVFRIDNLNFHSEFVEHEPLDGWEVLNRRMGRATLQTTFPASIRLSNSADEPVETRVLVSCKELLDKPEIRQAYAREVEIVDREIGRLLAGLSGKGMMDNTLVVFASDHGEGLGDHNHVGHISQLYDSLLDVPLIFTWPGRLPEGLVVDDPVGLVDVYPTITELLGRRGPEVTSGLSLRPLMKGKELPARAFIGATYRPESSANKRAIVLDGFKYIHSWRGDKENEELYDVINDPGELEDLARSRPAILERLHSELGRRLAEMVERSPVEAGLSEEDREHLRALGYIH